MPIRWPVKKVRYIMLYTHISNIICQEGNNDVGYSPVNKYNHFKSINDNCRSPGNLPAIIDRKNLHVY